MQPSHEAVSQGRALRIVLLALGGLVLAGVLVCAGIGFYVYRNVAPAVQGAVQVLEDTADSQTAAQSFLEALRDGRLDDAYGMTTDIFRERMSRRDLEDFCRKNAGLQESGPIDSTKLTFSVENLHARSFMYPVPGADGQAVAVQLSVVKEQNAFRIDDLSVAPLPNEMESLDLPDATPVDAPASKNETTLDDKVIDRP